MAQFIVVHGYKKDPAELDAFFTPAAAVGMAKAMQAREMPARCIKTWSPGQYGRRDQFVCLWEAAKPEDVQASLQSSGLLDYITADIMQVDETDWAQLAKMGG
jgi:hypothetical protein